jgi:hypothetical protein
MVAVKEASIGAVTVDLHLGDAPDDILMACERLGERGVPATFFVPTSMLQERRYRAVMQSITRHGHEPASHSHQHDYVEMRALADGTERDLDFLAISKNIHEDVFASSPSAFRSPCWCHLGPAALEMLVSLGYTVDSSSTPQRLGVFSSTPFGNVWTFAPRGVHFIAKRLLEVPTSTFALPAGSPTFSIVRGFPSRLLVRALAAEVHLLPGRVLSLQFHAGAFNPASTLRYPSAKLTPGAFLPKRQGGFEFKNFLRSNDTVRTSGLTESLLEILRPFRCLTMAGIYSEVRAGQLNGAGASMGAG